MYVFDRKNLISIFGIPYFPVLPAQRQVIVSCSLFQKAFLCSQDGEGFWDGRGRQTLDVRIPDTQFKIKQQGRQGVFTLLHFALSVGAGLLRSDQSFLWCADWNL